MSDRPTLGSATTRFFTRRARAAMLKLHTQAVSLKAYADSTLRSSECGCVAGSSSRRCTHCLTALESKSTALELLLLCFHPTTATKTLHTLDHSRPCHGRTAANSSIPAFHVDCSLYVYICTLSRNIYFAILPITSALFKVCSCAATSADPCCPIESEAGLQSSRCPFPPSNSQVSPSITLK